MSWQELISELYRARENDPYGSLPQYYPPAQPEDLDALESEFHLVLPDDLRRLLLETDGVMETIQVGGDMVESGWLVWPVETALRENRALRRQPDTPRSLFFIANPGVDGVLFGIHAGEQAEELCEVFAWQPVDHSIVQIAPSLQKFLEGWLMGEIRV